MDSIAWFLGISFYIFGAAFLLLCVMVWTIAVAEVLKSAVRRLDVFRKSRR